MVKTKAPARRSKPAAKKIRRGGREERARGAARPLAARRKRFAKRRFAPADRVFHLVQAPEGGTLGAKARTICCDKLATDVYAVALSKDRFDPPVTNWCAGAK